MFLAHSNIAIRRRNEGASRSQSWYSHFGETMADEPKPKKERTKPAEPGAKQSAERPKGKAKAAAAAPEAPPAPPPAEVAPPVVKPHTISTKVPKLEKKNKSRLPRKEKKARQKLAAAKGSAQK